MWRQSMLWLEIPILLLTCAGALYGIWTKPDLNRKVAITSTAITVLGMLLAVGLAIWKTVNGRKASLVAEQRRQIDLLTTLTAAELNDVEIVWSFKSAPKAVLDMLKLGDLMVDSQVLSDDEVSRLPTDVLSTIKSAWHLENAVFPLVAAVAADDVDLDTLYEGEAPYGAIRRWEGVNEPKSDWVDNLGSNVRYVGPTYDLLFPLNPRSNAVLALGKRADDVASAEPTLVWHEDYPSLFDETNYGFRATVQEVNGGIALAWQYDRASLLRAVVRPASTAISAGFPKRFSLFVVHSTVSKNDYLRKLPETPAFREPSKRPSQPLKWNDASTLKIYINGLETPHYTFDVTRIGTFGYAPDRGAYDAPEVEFEYTEFLCILRDLS
jgi:hypothetical protein